MVRPAVVLLLALCALGGSACGGSADEGPSRGRVTDLASVDQLRSAFAEDVGSARLVLLLSPT